MYLSKGEIYLFLCLSSIVCVGGLDFREIGLSEEIWASAAGWGFMDNFGTLSIRRQLKGYTMSSLFIFVLCNPSVSYSFFFL
jgi:hypothetical protein